MRPLYLQIYLTAIGVIVLFVLANVAMWSTQANFWAESRGGSGIAEVIQDLLPPTDRPQEELERAVEKLASRLQLEIAVIERGKVVASTSDAIREVAPVHLSEQTRFGAFGGLRGFRFHLPDGRFIVLRMRKPLVGGPLAPIGLLALAIGLGAYPLVRRFTRRIEGLHRRVEAFSEGDLSSRVEIEGRDEIAALGRGFNLAAERIERLVDAQRTLLHLTSHELRTPLTRMRLATESLGGDTPQWVRSTFVEEIDELDDLVSELLLASRLDTRPHLQGEACVEILALVAIEGAKFGATTTGREVIVDGDGSLIRRLVRNLFENAERYGGGEPIEAVVDLSRDGDACIVVEDGGDGIPEEERERIFEPFYRSQNGKTSINGGSGLGLFLVKRIAEHHGGGVRCEDRPGGGARFVVKLPAARAEGDD